VCVVCGYSCGYTGGVVATRSALVRVRLTEAEHAQLEAVCEQQGVTMSDYIRGVLFGARIVMVDPSTPSPSPLPDPPQPVSVAPVKPTRPNNDVMCVHRVPAGAFCKICDG
jgi:hypothetical protein